MSEKNNAQINDTDQLIISNLLKERLWYWCSKSTTSIS